MQPKGDIDKYRKALDAAGFEAESQGSIFNNDASVGVKAGSFRLLKLWLATNVVFAPADRRNALLSQLQHEFGDRLVEVYSVPCRGGHHRTRSLCVKITG